MTKIVTVSLLFFAISSVSNASHAPKNCPTFTDQQLLSLIRDKGTVMDQRFDYDDKIDALWQYYPQHTWSPPRKYNPQVMIEDKTRLPSQTTLAPLTLTRRIFFNDEQRAISMLTHLRRFAFPPKVDTITDETGKEVKREMVVKQGIWNQRHICSYLIQPKRSQINDDATTVDAVEITIATLPERYEQ